MNTNYNIPEYNITEFNELVKNVLSIQFSYIKIKGEISDIKYGRLGQTFITFKDDESVLNGVIWKNKKNSLTINPEIGMEVIATGKITTYAKSISTYQIDVENLEIAGEGALLKLIEDRKKRLSELGMFDSIHKKQLPYLPKKIGIITSPTGAVIHDMINRIRDRFPINIDLWPTSVQGKGAAKMIIEAIKGFNSNSFRLKPDVIIIARGGGSVEDLMEFNNEDLAKEVFASKIPIVSAIGHETDTNIIDLVSDLRAPTPTAAAEIVTPERLELIKDIKLLSERLNYSLNNKIKLLNSNINNFIRLLKDPMSVINNYNNNFLLIIKSIEITFKQVIKNKIDTLRYNYSVLKSPLDLYNLKKNKFTDLSKNINFIITKKAKESSYQFKNLSRLLTSNSINHNLKKGFVIVSKNKEMIKRAHSLKKNDDIKLSFFDKKIEGKIK